MCMLVDGVTFEMTETKELVRIEGLKMHFPILRGLFIQRKIGAIKAVDGLSFSINEGENAWAGW